MYKGIRQYLKNVSHVWHPLAGYGAVKRVGERTPGHRVLLVVIGPSVYWVRNGGYTRRHPHDNHHAHGPRWTGSGLCAQRVTDSDIALDRERRDGQDRRRRRHLGDERLKEAVRLAEPPRISFEDRIQLRRQTCTHSHAQLSCT